MNASHNMASSHVSNQGQSMRHSRHAMMARRSILLPPKDKSIIYFGSKNNELEKNKTYPDNTISTTKYNMFTFMPKSLLYQFKRIANIYFLIISILTCLNFSPKQPGSMIGTFAFVLFATMVKEAVEDYSRHKQDSQSNSKVVMKYEEGNWRPAKCWTLRPGDFVKIFKEEEFPADMLILTSSNDSGYCFIDTKNLDGETNLKEKCALEEFKDVSDRDVREVIGNIECDKANENLVAWEGIVTYKDNPIFANMKNLQLKGCVLKNTESMVGVVVYSGTNTKIMKNSKNPRQKTSKVLLIMNKLLYSLFGFSLIICIIFSILSVSWVKNEGYSYTYIYPSYNSDDLSNYTIVRFGLTFLTFFVAYSQIIPISLYVALELVKMIQGILIMFDSDMYDYELMKPAVCRATDLIEEIGQVEFIFSDKTGTLTQNNMILKKCYINGKMYGVMQEEAEDAQFTINGDKSLMRKVVSNNAEDKSDKQYIEDFFTLLALCHAVFPEKTDKGLLYQGSSPDDIALVKGAQQLGLEFVQKDFDDMTIYNHLTKESRTYQQKIEMPFDSDRKRMSVIVHDKLSKRYIMLTKGADNVMLSGRVEIEKDELNDVNDVLQTLSKEGLRILVMAQKFIEEKVYLEWEKRHHQARNQGKDLSTLYAELECGLKFIGCSAIEDKLQDGVPEAIHTLMSCNIRVWVLTGDKQDTALEIAKSCRLIDEDMTVVNLSTEADRVENKLFQIANELELDVDSDRPIDLQQITADIKQRMSNDLSIIIDGLTLEVVLNDETLAKVFFMIAVAARSVVCCRVSPKQKSRVVQLTKRKGPWITLSIGDGANDVPMIMEAHIGVGIQGKEGTQAVRSADYAIGQFRFLEKLLLVYGRNGYKKITTFICYYFYKNIILVSTEIIFALYGGFSGQIFFPDYLGTMYNAFFTSWPGILTFSLEREFDMQTVKAFPVLYEAGQKNYYFNLKMFWKYIALALIHSIFAFYIGTIGLNNLVDEKGTLFNHWHRSTVSFCLVIHVVTLKTMLMSDFWNIINIFGAIASTIFYYVCLFVLCSEYFAKNFQNEVIGVGPDIVSNSKALITVVVAPFFIVLPDIIINQIWTNFYPSPNEYLRNFVDSQDVKKIIKSEGPSSVARSHSNVNRLINMNPSLKNKMRSHSNIQLGKVALGYVDQLSATHNEAESSNLKLFSQNRPLTNLDSSPALPTGKKEKSSNSSDPTNKISFQKASPTKNDNHQRNKIGIPLTKSHTFFKGIIDVEDSEVSPNQGHENIFNIPNL